jgi:protein arginine kinase
VPRWAAAGEPESAVILSTRIRIARNLDGEIFPHKLDTEGRVRVIRKVGKALADSQPPEQGVFCSLISLNAFELAVLAERRAISTWMEKDENPRGVYLWKANDRALQVCTEDHIRLVDIVPGLCPRAAYDALLPTLNEVASYLHFAWSSNLGHLTTRPMNLGDGVHVSLVCHLPGLVMTRGIEQLLAATTSSGFFVTTPNLGGSDAIGNVFDFSCGPGLARSTQETLTRIESLGSEIQEREAIARIDLQTRHSDLLHDRIARNLAILQSCRVLTNRELTALLSGIRLGHDLGFITGLDRKSISLLSFELSRAYMNWSGNPKQSADERRQLRATHCREKFAEVQFVG